MAPCVPWTGRSGGRSCVEFRQRIRLIIYIPSDSYLDTYIHRYRDSNRLHIKRMLSLSPCIAVKMHCPRISGARACRCTSHRHNVAWKSFSTVSRARGRAAWRIPRQSLERLMGWHKVIIAVAVAHGPIIHIHRPHRARVSNSPYHDLGTPSAPRCETLRI